MGKVASFSGIDIVVRTRDEHCEPHVHAFHEGDGWELRIYFSYVTDEIIEVDLYEGSAPAAKVIQACMDKVTDCLDKARKLFWDAVQKVCLDNKVVEVVDGVIQVPAKKPTNPLVVSSAKYVSKNKSIEFTVKGSTQSYIARCP